MTLRSLRPTRRGVGVLVVAALAFSLGASSGARALNAIVVPSLVGVVASAIQLARADAPTVRRSKPEPGFPEETRRVTVIVESDVPCTVTEAIDDGLSTDTPLSPSATVGHGGTFEYELRLERRGEHEIGPATCRLTDSLGLLWRDVETATTTTALVYPDVYSVEGDDLAALVRRVLGNDRSSFDRLREFAPGDTMRDIHWRASAKRSTDEFVVAEYRSHSEATHVDIVGESALGSADVTASTVATIATHLHDAGVAVSVTVPDGACVAHPGDAASLLRLLAVTDDGWVDDEARADADVHVLGEGGRATVTLADGDRELDFEQFVGSHRGHEVVA